MDSILSFPNRMVALNNIEYRHDFTRPLGSPRAPNPFRLESERKSAKFHDAISCRMADLLDVALSSMLLTDNRAAVPMALIRDTARSSFV